MTTDDLLLSIRRRARIPVASALGSQDADLLSVANEEIGAYLVPMVLRQRADLLLTYLDVPILDPAAPIRIPARAIGARLKEVSFIDSSGELRDPPRIAISDMEGKNRGFYMQGGYLFMGDQRATAVLPPTMRLWYYARPGTLVLSAAAGVISAFNVAARTVTIATAPASFATATVFDVVSAGSPHETIGLGLSGTAAGVTITLASLPSDLIVGDYLCLPGEAPVVQTPPDLHPLLAQRVACKWLEVNDPPGYQTAAAELARMETTLPDLIGSRIEGEPESVGGNALWD